MCKSCPQEPAVDVYAFGPVSCSVCAPADMSREEVERLTNIAHPTGIESQWQISEDETFRTGQENGGIATKEQCPKPNTRHWLLVC